MNKETIELYSKIIEVINPLISECNKIEVMECLTLVLSTALCSSYELPTDYLHKIYNTIVEEIQPRMGLMMKSYTELNNVKPSS